MPKTGTCQQRGLASGYNYVNMNMSDSSTEPKNSLTTNSMQQTGIQCHLFQTVGAQLFAV